MRIPQLFSECVAALRSAVDYLADCYDALKRIDAMTMETLAILLGIRD